MIFVSCQTKHDQISIRPPEYMLCIRIMVWLGSLTPNVVHDFVFRFSRNICIGKDDYNIFPARVIVKTLLHEILQAFRQTKHERGTLNEDLTVLENALTFKLLRQEILQE